MGTQLVPDGQHEPGEPSKPFVPLVLDPEKAREMQVAKTETYRAKRREAQAQRKEAAAAALGPAIEGAEGALASHALDGMTNEELADLQVKRMAKIVLLGGPAFVPTTLKEATESAHTWSQVAKNESLRKGKVKGEDPEDDSPVQRAAKDLQRLQRQLVAVKNRRVG